jgi:hypothetical protein
MAQSRKSDFDEIAYERELLEEKLLDGLGQIQEQLADLLDLLEDPMDHLESDEQLLSILHTYIAQVSREVRQAEVSIAKELG